jgi:acyl carrier protein
MAVVRDEMLALIIAAIEELNPSLAEPVDLSAGADTALYGDDGVLDSLGLVALITAVEQQIEDDYATPISLIDERAISRARSPFRTVGSLAEFAVDVTAGAGEPV